MELTEQQQQILDDIRALHKTKTALNNEVAISRLLDIITTLQQPAPAPDQGATDERESDYEWDDQRRNWFRKAGG